MKKSQKITFSALLAAMSTALMLVSYFPYFTYAVPAVSGLFIMVVLIETGKAYSVGAYAVSAFLSLFLAEKESAVLYLCLFGFYPVLKAVIEKLKNRVLKWTVKIVVFNTCALLFFFICSRVLGESFSELNSFWKYGAYAFLALCNVAFVLYDIALSRLAFFYIARLHGKISSVFKR